MEQENQEIIDKIEAVRNELKEDIKNVHVNLELFVFGCLIVGLLVGNGMSLSKAIWIMFGCGFLWFIYTVYREQRNETKKTSKKI